MLLVKLEMIWNGFVKFTQNQNQNPCFHFVILKRNYLVGGTKVSNLFHEFEKTSIRIFIQTEDENAFWAWISQERETNFVLNESRNHDKRKTFCWTMKIDFCHFLIILVVDFDLKLKFSVWRKKVNFLMNFWNSWIFQNLCFI